MGYCCQGSVSVLGAESVYCEVRTKAVLLELERTTTLLNEELWGFNGDYKKCASGVRSPEDRDSRRLASGWTTGGC